MVIDSSALLALLLAEPGAGTFARAIAADPRRLASAFSILETAIVVVMDAAQVEIARSVYRRYGKGRHPAGLNIGDCCSYALSRFTGEPLLFKGDDFARTDVARAQ